jgi:hypothetical protein
LPTRLVALRASLSARPSLAITSTSTSVSFATSPSWRRGPVASVTSAPSTFQR